MPTEDLPDRLNRLDAMLLAIDDDEAMLLGELDGYICGVMVCPETILPDEWLPAIFADVLPEALSAAGDVAELHELILERYAEIAAEQSVDHYQPLYEVDTDGSMMWEIWVLGFERAMGLRPKAWEKLLNSRKESIAQESVFDIMSLLDFIHAESPPDKAASLAVAAEAPDLIPVLAGNLFRAHYLPGPSVPIRADSVGRNDPCPCGSGLKYKRCHGKT